MCAYFGKSLLKSLIAGLLLIGGAGSPTTTEFVKTNIEVGIVNLLSSGGGTAITST